MDSMTLYNPRGERDDVVEVDLIEYTITDTPVRTFAVLVTDTRGVIEVRNVATLAVSLGAISVVWMAGYAILVLVAAIIVGAAWASK